MSDEKIDHPAHYGGADDPYECIRVIDAWGLGFCLGNAVKYICRAGKKPGTSAHDDLRKAVWYLQHELETRATTAADPVQAVFGVKTSVAVSVPDNGVLMPVLIAALCPRCEVVSTMSRYLAGWQCDACKSHILPNDPGFDQITAVLNPASQAGIDTHEKY